MLASSMWSWFGVLDSIVYDGLLVLKQWKYFLGEVWNHQNLTIRRDWSKINCIFHFLCVSRSNFSKHPSVLLNCLKFFVKNVFSQALRSRLNFEMKIEVLQNWHALLKLLLFVLNEEKFQYNTIIQLKYFKKYRKDKNFFIFRKMFKQDLFARVLKERFWSSWKTRRFWKILLWIWYILTI